MRLTPAQRKALQWFKAHEPVGAFPMDGPSLSFVRRLVRMGLVEEVGREPGRFGFTKFARTTAGRAALAENGGDG